jgi:hypothetical protein
MNKGLELAPDQSDAEMERIRQEEEERIPPPRSTSRKGMVKISITIHPLTYEWITKEIAEGRFASISEAIRSGLDLLKHEQRSVLL